MAMKKCKLIETTNRFTFEKRWTDEFKKELIDSRVNPIRAMVSFRNEII